ncbi:MULTISPECIES: hypothetical protein [unclassified Pseudomonas]|uniref:hypothetical protein n=1 Tax=unclassified Pseudomonas TaxID=196821 RepID=UPI002AC8E0C3|nr:MULTISPECIES: hypothetical protein [unclassified Pseudomonas]MEB0044981.1 hypothetical protein [Pseudomonas sp. Dout3]MEB0096007.1 hypothetical protein [Pseudomonas sp. DC1.2]WPX57871.1 hypothetical protein RHM68_19990 [Pseudomonas sp. DC1.2]
MLELLTPKHHQPDQIKSKQDLSGKRVVNRAFQEKKITRYSIKTLIDRQKNTTHRQSNNKTKINF